MANETKAVSTDNTDKILSTWPLWLGLGAVLGTGLGTIIGGILVLACGETEYKTFDGPDGPYTDEVITDESFDTYFNPGMWGGAVGGFVLVSLFLAFLKANQSQAVVGLKSSLNDSVTKVCKFFGGGSAESLVSTDHSINNGMKK